MSHHGILVQRLALTLMLLGAVAPRHASAQEGPPARVLVVTLDDQLIQPVTARFVASALRQARESDFECVILQLDTPGGILSSTRHLVKEILTSEVPVVVYVAPSGARVGSAGVFITLAAHVAAMAPGTNLGTGDPISLEGPGAGNHPQAREAGKALDALVLSEKITQDAAAWARALAEHRGRNAGWASRAVRESLSTTAQQALVERVIDLVAVDETDLLRELDGRRIALSGRSVVLHTRGAVVERLSMSWPERLLSLLANPTLAYFLLMLGFVALTFEVTHPGIWIPGVLGLLCLVLAFFALQMLPINYAGLGLLLLGMLLVLLEVKVHSYGFLAMGGILSLLIGSAMLIEPVGGIERVSWVVMAPVTIALALITLLLLSKVVRVHRARVRTGMDGLIGAVARVKGDLKGEGFVFVSGELWKARCDIPLQDGEKVCIQGYDGLTLHVRPADRAPASAPSG